MAKDLPSFIAKEGANREGAVIREKNFIDANNYETVAYLKHLDVRNEPKMVLFENVPALNGKKSEFPMFYNPWVYAPVRRRLPRHGRHQIAHGSESRSRQAGTTTRQRRSHRAGESAGQGSRAHRRQGRSASLCPCPCTKKATPAPIIP